MSFVTAALITGGSALVGGYLSGQAAKQGAQTQADAMRESAAIQKAMFDTQNAQQAPYRQTGYGALNQIGQLGSGTYGIYGPTGESTGTGTGTGYLTRQFSPEDFQAGIDPSYNFRLQQGNLATTNLANQSGGAIGGNALQGLINYGQGAASQEYGNAFNRFQTQRSNIYNNLASIAGLGQTSLGQTGQLASNTAQGVGNAVAGAGTAIGAGQVGMANALSGGLQSAGNSYMLSNLLRPQNQMQMQTPAGYGTNVPQPINVNVG
ncbi:hypothetical protein UFOVP267_10 [uncultured Caudovirales phage]|uniref:DNA transfer protein p32 n=1 Tax=uncultured Caudovirales phage TaxID=2100421 RepID=A0A6J5LLZ8_9CAUD|nr:hypothetical protein UFOVP267_10 [uncultured Caudovirales phage]